MVFENRISTGKTFALSSPSIQQLSENSVALFLGFRDRLSARDQIVTPISGDDDSALTFRSLDRVNPSCPPVYVPLYSDKISFVAFRCAPFCSRQIKVDGLSLVSCVSNVACSGIGRLDDGLYATSPSDRFFFESFQIGSPTPRFWNYPTIAIQGPLHHHRHCAVQGPWSR